MRCMVLQNNTDLDLAANAAPYQKLLEVRQVAWRMTTSTKHGGDGACGYGAFSWSPSSVMMNSQNFDAGVNRSRSELEPVDAVWRVS